MSQLQDNLNEILRQKNTYLLPANLKKDVTVLGVTGTYEGSSVSIDGTVWNYKANSGTIQAGKCVTFNSNVPLQTDYVITDTKKLSNIRYGNAVLLDETTGLTAILNTGRGSSSVPPEIAMVNILDGSNTFLGSEALFSSSYSSDITLVKNDNSSAYIFYVKSNAIYCKKVTYNNSTISVENEITVLSTSSTGIRVCRISVNKFVILHYYSNKLRLEIVDLSNGVSVLDSKEIGNGVYPYLQMVIYGNNIVFTYKRNVSNLPCNFGISTLENNTLSTPITIPLQTENDVIGDYSGIVQIASNKYFVALMSGLVLSTTGANMTGANIYGFIVENSGGVLSVLSNRYIGNGYAHMIDGMKLIKYQSSSVLCIVGRTADKSGSPGNPMCYNIDFNLDNTDFIVSGLSNFGNRGFGYGNISAFTLDSNNIITVFAGSVNSIPLGYTQIDVTTIKEPKLVECSSNNKEKIGIALEDIDSTTGGKIVEL